MTRVALDSNILVYLAGVSRTADDDSKIERVRTLVEALGEKASLVAPVQALGELVVVLRRSGASAEEARAVLIDIAEGVNVAPSELRTALSAADLAVDHKLQFWDAMILSAAVDAGCVLLLSEDMQHGFVTRGVTVVNPLADTPNPRLAGLLDAR
jgi:predicted nucleic acid-binding protein